MLYLFTDIEGVQRVKLWKLLGGGRRPKKERNVYGKFLEVARDHQSRS